MRVSLHCLQLWCVVGHIIVKLILNIDPNVNMIFQIISFDRHSFFLLARTLVECGAAVCVGFCESVFHTVRVVGRCRQFFLWCEPMRSVARTIRERKE